jgi:hypothetical protein
MILVDDVRFAFALIGYICHGGIWICGNYRSCVAFPDCVTFGYEHAKVVKEYLDKK